ncbi:FAD/NAD-P-binding domain-containing protein [Trametopsis cervina]|nr:FAD/NAD-P-binding domain-containing protein [Trametopsis cervina]
MKSGLVQSAFLFALAEFNSASASDPVCIVGAGPGGLTIAHELEAKGISTVTFEKQPEVGGKCQAYYDGPNQSIFHPMGALLFTNQTYKDTLPLVRAANLPLTPGVSQPNGWQYWLYGPDAQASNVTKMPPASDAETALVIAEIARYTVEWEAEFAPKYIALRYTNGVPQQLTVPFGDWLKSKAYIAIPTIVEAGMVPYGYGDITQTPAIYMLQYFTPEVLSAFVGITQGYIVDFHKVFVHYAQSVKGPVHTNTTVTQIDRTGTSPVITYSSSGQEANITCSSVVLAFPPTIANLDAINMPLTANETAVFTKVGITPYWSSATATKIAYPFFYQQSPPEPLGEPVGFLRVFNGSPIATTYSWGPPGSENTLSLADVRQNLINTITAVQTGAGIADPTVSEDDVKDLRQWDYFPHFATTDLQGGAYAEFNAVQGVKGTYYSSGLNGFETVEFAIRAGKDLVKSFF